MSRLGLRRRDPSVADNDRAPLGWRGAPPRVMWGGSTVPRSLPSSPRCGVFASTAGQAGQKRLKIASQSTQDRFLLMGKPLDLEWSQGGYAQR